jgi:hypothetical protein
MSRSAIFRSIILWATLALAGVPALAQLPPPGPSGPFLNTLAWTRYSNAYFVNGIVDSSGNSYVIYNTIDGSNIDFSMTRYDVSGNATLTKKFASVPSTVDYVGSLCLSPVIGGKQFVYVESSGYNGAGFASAMKLDTSGNLIWTKTYGDSAHDYTQVAIAADASGNAYVAVENLTTNKEELYEYDATGTQLHGFTESKIYGTVAKFAIGKWFIDGTNPTAHAGTVKWGCYDPTTGKELASDQLNFLDNGTYTYRYYAPAFFVNDSGAVYWGVNVLASQDHGSGAIVTNHFVRSYTSTGVQVWASKSFNNGIDILAGPSSGGPIWAEGYNTGTSSGIETYDLHGNRTSIQPNVNAYSFWAIQPDATGVYLFVSDQNSPKLTFERMNFSGTVVYSTTIASLGGDPGQCELDSVQAVNGAIYIFCMVPIQTGKAVFQRYVPGVTLSTVSGAATTASGSNYTLKVQLNSPAPTGGISVSLASSSVKLLFPNNMTTYSVAIPAGSLYANVVLKAGVVASNTAVNLIGTQNGVARQAAVTITQ